ncbi:tetratricopeptide repeat protein [Rheinheimera baltica]|uniref:Tetratricopeptide repeat protein n=2 Tax=Rheinheimera baltica TaxID=67576 RepID=A0ABT9I1B6_9GAMM|nr:tetratricopeptide repeat protein [Rheinheimera baltica]MDP5136968.1 tetratricopeptide repeat protein [Rheinheimera baltica]
MFCLSACSSTGKLTLQEPTLPYSDLLAQVHSDVPSVQDIFSLTIEQEQEFLAYFHAPEHQDLAGRKRLYNFLSQHTAYFDYQGHNYTASQAYRLKAGNCISLAVLTKALADVVGVDIKFQSIISAPVFDMKNSYMLSSDHVRTFLYESDFVSKRGNSYFLQPLLVIDYLPAAGDIVGENISEKTFIAMFYRNLAADALLKENYHQALALLKTALSFDPTYGAVINLVAITHRRLNEPELAAKFYEYGLQVSNRKTSLTSNYAVLKQLQGDEHGAEQLRQSLSRQDDNDPYFWYLLGKTAIEQRHPADAAIYFSKAIERAPYMHELYLELAVAQYQNEQPQRARNTLERAAEMATAKTTQQRYFAKLDALKRSVEAH